MNTLCYSFIVYYVLGIVLSLLKIPDADQFSDILIIVPFYTFLPFLIICFFLIKSFNLGKKKQVLWNTLLFSIAFSIATAQWVYYLNMNIGEHKKITIAGQVISKKPGKGNSKPVITIKNTETTIHLAIKRSVWTQINNWEGISIDLRKGRFGFYYLQKGELAESMAE